MTELLSLHRTLEQELFALLRGASMECLVCGEFVMKKGAHLHCPECGATLREHGVRQELQRDTG